MTEPFVCLPSGRRRRPFCLSRSRCGLPLQPDECLRPRRAKEFRPRVRDAFVSPLRDRSRCDAAKISDLPRSAQRVNDCACVHVRHHRTCAARPQGFFVLTKNACILFFSALKFSHRSTEHRLRSVGEPTRPGVMPASNETPRCLPSQAEAMTRRTPSRRAEAGNSRGAASQANRAM